MPTGDDRRDRGFTIFYMGINAGALIAPILTGWLAEHVHRHAACTQNYKVVFVAAGVGMLISLVWFWFGRRQLGAIGRPAPRNRQPRCVWSMCAIGVLVADSAGLLADGSRRRRHAAVAACRAVHRRGRDAAGRRRSAKAGCRRDRVIAMLIIFIFNMLFWMFFEQAGSSFNFLAENIVDRDLGGWMFPIGWFQSVNPHGDHGAGAAGRAGVGLAGQASHEPSIPRKFGLGLIGNALALPAC